MASNVTPENDNFTRITHLLIDCGQKVLADKLHQSIKSSHYSPKTFENILNHPTVQYSLQRSPVNSDQLLNLYPNLRYVCSNCNTGSTSKKCQDLSCKGKVESRLTLNNAKAGIQPTDCDISLLCLLLRSIPDIQLLPHFNSSWKNPPLVIAPKDPDEVRIARIRIYRNELYAHVKNAEINDADFKKYWKNLVIDFKALSSAVIPDETYKYLKTGPVSYEHFQERVDELRRWYQEKLIWEEVSDKVEDVKVAVLNEVKDAKAAVSDEVKDSKSAVLDEVKQVKSAVLDEVKDSKAAVLDEVKDIQAEVGNVKTTLEDVKVKQEHFHAHRRQFEEEVREGFVCQKRKLDGIDNDMQQTSKKQECMMCGIKQGVEEIREDISQLADQVQFKSATAQVKIPEPDDILELVVSKLKSHYVRNSYVTPILWNEGFKVALDKTYTTLTITDRQNRQDRQKEVDIDKIFDPSYSSTSSPSSNYVLIEGNAGTGKTTLSKQMAYTWAQGTGKEENFYGVEKFKMVFLLKVRDLTGNLMDDIFTQKLLPEDFPKSRTDVWKLITCNEKDVLFIFDGFDEIRQENEHLDKVLNGAVLSDISIIVTSRCGCLKKFKNFQTILTNEGFKLKQAKEFVKKYTHNKATKKGLRNRVNNLLDNNNHVQELSRTPLCLVFIIILVEENEKVAYTTETNLYQDIVTVVIRRYFAKVGRTVRNLGESVKTLSIRIGELALKGLEAKKLTYEKGDIGDMDNDVNCCGFIIRDESDSLIDPVDIYYFIHKSLQEYFAACKIYHKQLPNLSFLSSEDWSQVLKFVLELSFSKGSESDLNVIKQIIFDAPGDSIISSSFSGVEFSRRCFVHMPEHFELSGVLKLCYDACPQELFPQMIKLLLEKLPNKIFFDLNVKVNENECLDQLEKCIVIINEIDKIESVIMCVIILDDVWSVDFFSSEILKYLNKIMNNKKIKLFEITDCSINVESEQNWCQQYMVNSLGCKTTSLCLIAIAMSNVNWFCHNYLEKIDQKEHLSLVIDITPRHRHNIDVCYNEFFNRYVQLKIHVSDLESPSYEEIDLYKALLVTVLKSVKHVEKKEFAMLSILPISILKSERTLSNILLYGPVETLVFYFRLSHFDRSHRDILSHFINIMYLCKEVKQLAIICENISTQDYDSSRYTEFEDQFVRCLNSDHCWRELKMSTLPFACISSITDATMERICKDKKMNVKLSLLKECSDEECVKNFSKEFLDMVEERPTMYVTKQWAHADQFSNSSFVTDRIFNCHENTVTSVM